MSLPAPSYALTVTQTLGERPRAHLFCTTQRPTGLHIGSVALTGQCQWQRDVEPAPLEDLGAAIAAAVRVWLDEHARPSHLAPGRQGPPLD